MRARHEIQALGSSREMGARERITKIATETHRHRQAQDMGQETDGVCFAHSAPGKHFGFWETLRTHSAEVAEIAAAYAGAFGFAEAGRAGGLLHDIGNCSPAFQSHIRALGDSGRGPNHAYAGALLARERYPGPFGRILSSIIAGHHAGLVNGTDLAFDGWSPKSARCLGRRKRYFELEQRHFDVAL